MSLMPSNISAETKIGFALQGGGIYGAYTKNVVSKLLENGIIPSAITGTSSGAAVAVISAYALQKGGPQLARKMLDDFFENHIPYATLNSYGRHLNPDWPNIPPFLFEVGKAGLELSRLLGFSSDVPQMLRNNIRNFIPDWEVIRDNDIQLFINAVGADRHHRFGHLVFENNAICPEAIAASGALKQFGGFRHRDITYYDGAYARNPSLERIIQTGITDLIVITVSRRPKIIKPGLQKDWIDTETLVDEGLHYRLCELESSSGVRIHTIELPMEAHWDPSSQVNTDPEFRRLLEAMADQDATTFLNGPAMQIRQQTPRSKGQKLDHAA